MDTPAAPGQTLNLAIAQLLRPLVRLLLRHGVPYAAFAEMARQTYAEVAMQDFPLPDKRPSIARVSILTGLTRKEVHRRLAAPAAVAAAAAARHNRAVRVLTAWVRDPDFLDPEHGPRALPLEGELGFAALVRRHSGDMPARAVLDELLRIGAVRRRDDGCFEPAERGYVPLRSPQDKLRMLGTDVADLIATIDHNIEHGASDPRFQRKVMYLGIPTSALPLFRRWSAGLSQALLEKLDHWLAERDAEGAAFGPEEPRARVGVGIYYVEEPRQPPAAASETP